MRKTLTIYTIFISIFAIQAALIFSLGDKFARDLAIPFAIIDSILILIGIILDRVGFLALILASLPFSYGIGQIEIGIVTFNPYILGMIFYVVIMLPEIFRFFLNTKISVTERILLSLSLVFFISTLYSDDLIGSGYLAFHAIFIPLITFIVLKYSLRKEDEWEKVNVIFLSGTVAFAAFAIIAYAETQTRATAFGVPYIGVATLMVVPIIKLITMHAWRNIFLALSLLISIIALLVTFSRMYLVVLLFAPLMYRFIRKGFAASLIVALFSISMLFTLTLVFMPKDFNNFSYDKEEESTYQRITNIENWMRSLYGRAYAYEYGFNNFYTSPIVGVGLYKGKKMVTQHNFNVEWLEYGGLLGYFLYIAVFIYHFRHAQYWAKHDTYIASNLLIILVILANSSTNGFMHGIMPIVAFLVMGLTESRIRILKQIKSKLIIQKQSKHPLKI